MSLSELFNLRETVESRVNQYWTFWSVGIFAACGWFLSGGEDKIGFITTLYISFGMILFFAANLIILLTSTKLSVSVLEEICRNISKSEMSENFKEDICNCRIKNRTSSMLYFHVIVDVVVVFFIITRSIDVCDWRIIFKCIS